MVYVEENAQHLMDVLFLNHSNALMVFVQEMRVNVLDKVIAHYIHHLDVLITNVLKDLNNAHVL
jgi:hypothetical protein